MSSWISYIKQAKRTVLTVFFNSITAYIEDKDIVKITRNFAASSHNYYLMLSKRGDQQVFPRNKVLFVVLTACYNFPVVFNSSRTCFVPIIIIIAVVLIGTFFDRQPLNSV